MQTWCHNQSINPKSSETKDDLKQLENNIVFLLHTKYTHSLINPKPLVSQWKRLKLPVIKKEAVRCNILYVQFTLADKGMTKTKIICTANSTERTYRDTKCLENNYHNKMCQKKVIFYILSSTLKLQCIIN